MRSFDKIILFFLFFPLIQGVTPSQIEGDSTWPIFGHTVIDTHLNHWQEQFFTLDEEGRLFKFSFGSGRIKKQEVYDYSDPPDIIKHFSLESGDLFVAIFKKEKKIRPQRPQPRRGGRL